MGGGGCSCEVQSNQQCPEVVGGPFGSRGPGGQGQTGQVILSGFLTEVFGTLLGEVQVGVGIHGLLRVKPLPLWHPCSVFLPVPMVRLTPSPAHARGG